MPAAPAILAVDQGTSGTKAIVAEAGTVLAVAEAPVAVHYGPGGAVEVDPQALLRSVVTAGRAALAEAGRPVAGVALANQGETVLAWDPDDGRPLSPAVVWQDRRAETVVAPLLDHAELVRERTGLELDPYFSAPKLAWLRSTGVRGGVVTTSDTWLVHRLCGAFVTDVSTASRSLLTDLDALAGDAGWDADLLALFGLGGERLPAVVDNDQVVGTTTTFGDQPLPVGGLIVDQQAALLGQGCLDAGSAKCTFGTGAFLLVNTGTDPTRSRSGLAASAAWRLRGCTSYCLDGQVYASATVVRWLQQLRLVDGPAELDAACADDAGDALCVPALSGLGAPWWRPGARAAFTGLTMDTTAGMLVLSALQGIAAQVAAIVDAAGADLAAPMSELRVDGGLVRSDRLMQAVADIAQLRVAVTSFEHATAVGAAAAGALAADPSLTVADSVPHVPVRRVFEPVWSADRAAGFRARWEATALA